MDLHVVAVEEADHVDTVSGVEVDAGGAADGFAHDDAACDVDDLEGGVAFVVDDEAAVAEEGEAVVVVTGGEDEAEAVGVVGRSGLEGVARVGEQVLVGAGEVVDEVEVGEVDVLGGEVEAVGAVALGLEADGHLAHALAADDGIVLIVHGDVELGAVGVELDLGQGAALSEADDGAVEELAAAADAEGEVGVLAAAYGCEGDGLGFCPVSEDEDAFHSFDLGRFGVGDEDAVAFVVDSHPVEGAVDGDIIVEGVAHEVPAAHGLLLVGGVIFQGEGAIAGVGVAGEVEGDVGNVGIEVALACFEGGEAELIVSQLVVHPFVAVSVALLVEVVEVELVDGQVLHSLDRHVADGRGDEVPSAVVAIADDVLGDAFGFGRGEAEHDGIVIFAHDNLGVFAAAGDILDVHGAVFIQDAGGVVVELEVKRLAAGSVEVDVELEARIGVAVLGVVVHEGVTSALVADEGGNLEVLPVVFDGDVLTVDLGEADDGVVVLVGVDAEIGPIGIVRVLREDCPAECERHNQCQ